MNYPSCHSCEISAAQQDPSSVWATRVPIKELPEPLGTVGSSLAACQTCHCFTCGHHGLHDPSAQAFICLVCDPPRIAANAAVMTVAVLAASGPPPGNPELAQQLREAQAALQTLLQVYAAVLSAIERFPFATLEDLERRHVAYSRGFFRGTTPDYLAPLRQDQQTPDDYRSVEREKALALEALRAAPGMAAILRILTVIIGRDWPQNRPDEFRQAARRALEFFAIAGWLVWYHRIPAYLLSGPLGNVAIARQEFE